MTGVDNPGARIVQRAMQLGFSSVGIVPVQQPANFGAYQEWIEAGYHGKMSYLENVAARADQDAVLSGAQSIIALTSVYLPQPQEDPAQNGPGRIARYAQGYDYHGVLEHRLERLAGFVQAELGAQTRTRACVDRLPILERDVACLAGLGWFGKNTMILNRRLGSWFFLSELVVDAEITFAANPARNYCGTCTACLDACPTDAFVGPYIMDARRCISYLTIELRGPIPKDLRSKMGDHLFGCDICQDVCPWNRKAPATKDFPFLGRPEILAMSADRLLGLTERDFRRHFALSPVQRAGRAGLLRNAAVVLGNTKDMRWVPLLARVLTEEQEPLVRGHTAWALGQLGDNAAGCALDAALKTEEEPYVIEEILSALGEMQAASMNHSATLS